MVGLKHSPVIDIRVDSPYKDLLLIKGSSYESPSFELKGTVEIKASDTCSARQLRLRLVGVHKLDFHHMVQQEAQHSMVAVREEKTVLECCWDDLLTSPEGHITSQYPQNRDDNTDSAPDSAHTPPSSTPSSSYTNLFHLGSSSSSTSLSSMSSNHPHAIPHGTHSVPFQIVLPGDIAETVEGLGSGSVLYRLEATLEKSSYKSNVVKHKYLRIMRTMSADALAMSESMFIGSTWPAKVQYEFSIPSRNVALGSTTPVQILLVPLVKGLVLGAIKAQVVQQYLLKSTRNNEESFQESQVIVESTMHEHEGTTLMDSTRIESEIKIPDYLKLCTPNCDLPNDIVKVRHKIKLQIELKNSDGHTSELRTNLPISLFLSPHHPVHARRVELDKQGKIYFTRESDTLFANGAGASPSQDSNEENETLPSYESHVYDQVFTPIGSPSMSPMGSLPSSGIATPMPRLHAVNNNIDDYFSISPSQLPSRAASPMLTPQDYTLHLREQLQKLSFERLSQVPTYEEAIHTDTPNSPDLEFAPEYEPDDHYQLGDSQGLAITTNRSRRTSSNLTHSPTRHSPLSPSPVHYHENHLHHHLQDDLYHPLPHHLQPHSHSHSPHHLHHSHGPSPLRSVSTTNLKDSSVLKQNSSSSNLSKLMGVTKLMKSHSSVNVKK